MNIVAKPEPATLHERIRAEIEARILSGAWRPGHRIPFEHELTAQFGCARMTVSKAIQSLVDAGLVVRRRRAGSFVAQPRLHAMVLDVPDIQADIAARGERHGLRLLSRQKRQPRDAGETALAGPGQLLALRCLHLANDAPFALEDRLIALSAVPEAETADFSATAPGSWLLDHVPWTEAEHRITAINADRETSELLGITGGTACLALERRTWRGAQDVTQVRQLFPGAAYDLVARFKPNQGGGS